jgi:hypothetical protein
MCSIRAEMVKTEDHRNTSCTRHIFQAIKD